MKKKLLAGLLVGVLIFSGCTIKVRNPKAVENINREVYDKTIIVFGEGLPKAERETLKEYFKGEDTVEFEITKEDYKEIFNIDVDSSSLLSSVAVNYVEGKGINTEILTPENITEVKDHQYTNAALTSGLIDANIRVMSTRKVTGESALAGVFKAYELLGLEPNGDKLKTAQEELGVVTEISVNLNDEDLNKLSNAIVATKERLAQNKKDGNEGSSNEILKEELKDQGVEITEEQENKLSAVLDSFKNNLSEEDIQVYLDRASEIGKSIINGGIEAFNKAKDSGFFEKIYNTVRGWFN